MATQATALEDHARRSCRLRDFLRYPTQAATLQMTPRWDGQGWHWLHGSSDWADSRRLSNDCKSTETQVTRRNLGRRQLSRAFSVGQGHPLIHGDPQTHANPVYPHENCACVQGEKMKTEDLAATIQPSRTTLLFGAGTSIPSGAPTGLALGGILAAKLGRSPGEELSEVAQIFENRFGRPELTKVVRAGLKDLTPAAGLLTLPAFDWMSIYTTNYDTLIEQSYSQARRDLQVCRSNYEVTRPRDSATTLYKIHGCVTQDSDTGHKNKMLITESDYDDYDKYRQTLFNMLQQDMFTADTIIIGQSLNDRHLKELVKRVCGLKQEGIQARVFLMVHTYDEDKASLFTRLGVDVVHGDLEDLLRALLVLTESTGNLVHSTSTQVDSFLTPDLLLTSQNVQHAAQLTGNPVRLFNGTPATYADIASGHTIPRAALSRIENAKNGARGFFLVIAGSRGVGKTTLARTFVLNRMQSGMPAWEHLSDHALDVQAWAAVELKLRQENRDGILFIDDCTRHLRAVNKLVDHLNSLDRSHLRIIVTAEAAKWKVSPKSRGFFSKGDLIRISVLERTDIDNLINLLDQKSEIRALVESHFLELSRTDKVRRLREKCSSDMFVCLKNIFANDNLDNILLQEYAELSNEAQEVYRYVAAIQAMGGFVHRQLIMRVTGIGATGLSSLLNQLDGIVSEYTIDHRNGIYGWCTRHDVIAETIARWKFADQDDLQLLLASLIDGLNPSVRIEMENAIAIASNDAGINRVTSLASQVKLYRSLIETIPGHHTPRRRLVRLFLRNEMLSDAENEITQAERALGKDPVISRHKALLTLRKAELTPGITDSDRTAMLLDAEGIIRRCIRDFEPDLYSYRTLGEIGLALIERSGDFDAYDDAVKYLQDFESLNGDPEIANERRRLVGRVRSLGFEVYSGPAELPEVEPASVDS